MTTILFINPSKRLLLFEDYLHSKNTKILISNSLEEFHKLITEYTFDGIIFDDKNNFILDNNLLEIADTHQKTSKKLFISYNKHNNTLMTLLKHQIHHCIFRPDDNNILPDKLDDLFQEIFKNKQKDSILAIGAHPDDIEIGCGGTLVKLIEKGHPVHILVLSSGERGNNSNRYEEALQSANHLGASITVETLKDTAIPSGTPTIQLIEKAIDKHQPQIVYSHSIHDNHQDHRSTHKATIIAARQIPFLLNYHSPSCTTDFTAKHFEVLDDKTIAKKIELLEFHESQMKIRPYMQADFIRASSLYWGRYAKYEKAEPFEVLRL
jgi:LmbE family N-acetylglucosaminyl deacetylase